MKKSYFWGVLFALFLIWGATVLSGTSIGVYISVPSLFMVVGLSGVLTVFSWDLRTIGRCFKAVFSPAAEEKDMQLGIVFFSSLTTYFFLSAAVATGTGVIAILTNLSDNMAVGQVVALALLSTYYSLILTLLVTLPFRTVLRKKIIEMRE